jgi:biotin operon repressor
MNQLFIDQKTAVLCALQAHIGASHGVTARDLAILTSMSEREVRAQVSALREEGIAVCGHPRTGYFIAATSGELQTTVDYLTSRALHSLRLASRLARIPLPDLLGQLKLKT